MLHHTLHIHPRLRQYRAGITTKNILDGPRLDRRLAADHRYQAGPRPGRLPQRCGDDEAGAGSGCGT